MRRADFPARAERVEFSRLSIIRLNAYSARKEGRTTAERAGFSLCHSKVIGVRHREMDFRSVLDEGDDGNTPYCLGALVQKRRKDAS